MLLKASKEVFIVFFSLSRFCLDNKLRILSPGGKISNCNQKCFIDYACLSERALNQIKERFSIIQSNTDSSFN